MPETVVDPTYSPPPDAAAFFAESLKLLKESGIPFLLSGTYAVTAYTGIQRPTKDLDVFCKAGDYPCILAFFQARGYRTEVEDERWIATAFDGDNSFDVIFAMSNGAIAVADDWFAEDTITLYDHEVRITPPPALAVPTVFVHVRYRWDAADVSHVILIPSGGSVWTRLLQRMERYWEELMAPVLIFRSAYPTERGKVRAWLMSDLTERLPAQVDLP